MPERQDFVLVLARILLLRGETRTARNALGPLLARGDPPIPTWPAS
ncbi:MAG: hypothetical protein R2712_16870 [Vicinamibacterales bacterium]